MRLTDDQKKWLEGQGGRSLQWAMEFNLALGQFFDAETMVPVSSAHFAPDLRMGGKACVRLLEETVETGAKVRVPSYLDPCSVDFGRADTPVPGLSTAALIERQARRKPWRIL